MIFVDRQCPTCHGNGCEQCHGTGIIGCVNSIPLWKHKDVKIRYAHKRKGGVTPLEIISFGFTLRCWRLDRGYTFRELGAKTGILPSVLSEIENGMREPTDEQRRTLEEIMR